MLTVPFTSRYTCTPAKSVRQGVKLIIIYIYVFFHSILYLLAHLGEKENFNNRLWRILADELMNLCVKLRAQAGCYTRRAYVRVSDVDHLRVCVKVFVDFFMVLIHITQSLNRIIYHTYIHTYIIIKVSHIS